MSDQPDMTREEITSLLRFYEESGLDFPVADAPLDRFEAIETPASAVPMPEARNNQQALAEPAQSAAIGASDPNAPATIEMDPRKRHADAPTRPIAEPAAVTLPTEEVVAKAVATADAANDLDALRQAVETFEGCNLKRSARSTIFEGGNRDGRIMIIRGAPSRDDDASGSAFSGADGLLLQKMLAAIKLDHQKDAYYGFCVPWSPPGGSPPTPLHLEICAPFLAKQINLAAPEMVIVMGNTATRHVFQTKQTITQVHGKWTVLPGFDVPALAIFDPAMLRAQPRMKRAAWLDLLSLKTKLDETK